MNRVVGVVASRSHLSHNPPLWSRDSGRGLKSVLAILLFALALPLFFSRSVDACRMAPCRTPDPERLVKSAELLFHGRAHRILDSQGREVSSPLEIRDLAPTYRGIVEFEVLGVWKGDARPVLRIVTGFQNGGNCERTYVVGEEYIVWSLLASSKRQAPVIENCQAIGPGGWPANDATSVKDFARALGPTKWSADG